MDISLSPFAPENLSCEMSSAALSRTSLLISILRLNLVLTHGIPPDFRGDVQLFIYTVRPYNTPSGQSRVYRVTQLRTEDVHYRKLNGTGPDVLKAVPGTGAAFAGHYGTINVSLSFPPPTIGMMCTTKCIFF